MSQVLEVLFNPIALSTLSFGCSECKGVKFFVLFYFQFLNRNVNDFFRSTKNSQTNLKQKP